MRVGINEARQLRRYRTSRTEHLDQDPANYDYSASILNATPNAQGIFIIIQVLTKVDNISVQNYNIYMTE